MRSHFCTWRSAIGATLALNLLLLGVFAQAPKAEDKKPPMIDEEETTPPPKAVVRIEDKTTPKNPARPVSLDIDLGQAAQSAKHPGIRELFSNLAIPHDVVHITNPLVKNRPDELVKPLKDYIGNQPSRIAGKIKLHPFDKEWKDKPELALSASAVKEVVHYEQLAEQEVDKFLGERWEGFPPGNEKYLSSIDKLIAAEQALAAAARFHEAARESEVRKGDAWNKVREDLRGRLLKVSLDRMQLLIEEDKWEAALALVSDTVKRFPTPAEQKVIAEPMAKIVQKLLDTSVDASKYKVVFSRLREIERSLPLADSTGPIRKRLVELAQPHLTAAIELKKANRLKEARDELRQAADIYPYLPGLKDLELDVDEGYPTLHVGVRELPLNMSPALAFNDAERQVVEMLFEGLYELGPEPDGGRFRPALARGRPGLVALGREIVLPRDAFWSNGKPIDSSDVVSTLRLLRGDWSARSAAWADDLMDDAVITDPYQIKLTLKQGCLDPLALMSFKVLPGPQKLKQEEALRKPSDKDFAQKPIGSGPFMFDPNAHSDGGRSYARFLANPYYRSRPGRVGLPRIREIQLFASDNPVKEMADGKLDVVPDVPLEMVAAMRKAANVTVAGPLPTRRIYMLAVNHRRPNLDSAPLRRALALAIPRDKILNDFFRHDLGDQVHQPLCGPYPTGSWACPPRKLEESDKTDPLFNVTSAKAAFRQAKKDKVALTLKYPAGDPAVQKAMEFLKKQLETELPGLAIELKPPMPLKNLRDDVAQDHDYDLAYYWYDYPDPTFWLWPILDPRSAQVGGPNFLGYNGGGGRLEQLCRNALNHRNFKNVQELTHTIHSVFVQQEMPFIPLWQLDRFLAHSNSVQILDGTRQLNLTGTTPEIDPLRVFGTVEYWRLNRTR